jgi:chemotaxis protein CheX
MVVPFVNSVRQVFTKMVRVNTTVAGVQIKGSPAPSYDVSGIIGFSGEVTGCVVVSFQKEAAVKLVNALAGMEIEYGSADFTDAIGELANMIAGSAKKDLGAPASISIPSVILGAGHTVARLSDVPCIVIPCKTPVGDFAVEVSIKQVKPNAA